MEDTIRVVGRMRKSDRAKFLNANISDSIADAANSGKTLALIRPSSPRFFFKRKTASQIEKEREGFRQASRQDSFFDNQLAAMEPCPFVFRFEFRDAGKRRVYTNADWEAYAMFFNGLHRTGSEAETLRWMDNIFNEKYAKAGMMFCVGNMAKRPQTWQLLGVLRVDESEQPALF